MQSNLSKKGICSYLFKLVLLLENSNKLVLKVRPNFLLFMLQSILKMSKNALSKYQKLIKKSDLSSVYPAFKKSLQQYFLLFNSKLCFHLRVICFYFKVKLLMFQLFNWKFSTFTSKKEMKSPLFIHHLKLESLIFNLKFVVFNL